MIDLTKHGLKVYAFVITLIAAILLILNYQHVKLNNEMNDLNNKLIQDKNQLQDEIAGLQEDKSQLLDDVLQAEYNAMTRVVTVYCGDD